MTMSRRNFLRAGAQIGVAASAAMLWNNRAAAQALSSFSGSNYKAVVLITLAGGNDGNNTVVPLDKANYAQYAKLRGSVALAQGGMLPLYAQSNGAAYGLHPSLGNIASLINRNKGMVIANIGSLPNPATKAQVLANNALYPGTGLSHATGLQQWESAQATSYIDTGWGGRMADYLSGQSGILPPVLSAAGNSLFTVGKNIQAVAVQSTSGFVAMPPELNNAIAQVANAEKSSQNQLVQQMALIRSNSMAQQQLIDKAAGYATLQTQFGSKPFAQAMQRVAQLLAGRSVLGASRQMFYIRQGNHDTHTNQLSLQADNLSDLDAGIGSFFSALDELGLTDQVLVCTHSDFSRSMQPNINSGTDHGWGNHHFILGGGVAGGKIIGSMPDFTLGGSSDLGVQGVWIPTQSVVQMTAGIGRWMGLSRSQVSDVFPDLQNFPTGAIQLT